MPESVRPPERVATVPQVKERSPREEREQQAARKTPRKPPAAHQPESDEEPHALDVEV
ncbi:MAG: hypothetical protein KatS3mg020_1049 [Fimbriimonadales bacterium]|nr:MAG: hypothetical protein KatS3mg019_2179 [Fimbriimonadales bacterium]GIV11558.1 MAG: hypothetical protein KatS3mg020_1049 [Fimbriimonadales bacterium]